MDEQYIISMYNHHLEQTNQSETPENYELFMQGLLLDNIISINQYNNLMEGLE
jgi:hypothetical protein